MFVRIIIFLSVMHWGSFGKLIFEGRCMLLLYIIIAVRL